MQGVTALDIPAEVRQGTLLEQAQLGTDAFLALALEHLERQGELGHFDSLGIDVHAVDVGEQDALLFGGGQLPAALRLINNRGFPFCKSLGVMLGIPGGMPVEQILVGAQQEGTGTAGGIKNL